MAMLPSCLPDFENPPLVEVVFGAQFQELREFKAPHTGMLWERLGRAEYPVCEEKPPLTHVNETFDNPAVQLADFPLVERIDHPPLPRIFFVNEVRNHLVQVQRDRFLQNWRKVNPDDNYPRYSELFPGFQKSWETFVKFVKEHKIGDLLPDQYELTYLNHIVRGKGWDNVSDISKVFPQFQRDSEESVLPQPESIAWRRVYRLPGNKGRLYVSMRQGIIKSAEEPILVVELTARGFDDVMRNWFDMAHEWIVNAFVGVTARDVQETVWKRRK